MTKFSDLNWFKDKEFKESAIYSRSPKQLGSIIDHMEMRAICHMDKIFSLGDFLNIRGDEAAFNGTENVFDGDEVVKTIENRKVYPDTITADKMALLIKRRLEYRQERWGDIWPFLLEVSPRGHCSIAFLSDHPGAKLYTYFLLALYSKYVVPANDYRNFFEECCYHLASRLFPENSGWIVKRAGAGVKGQNAYTGNKPDKLDAISNDLFLSRRPDRYFPTNSGDGGIDLVAFHQLCDRRGNLPVIFMQCACSCDIDSLEAKTLEVSHIRLQKYLNLDVMHEWFLFSPYDWYDSIQPSQFVSYNNDAVIFDRGRILNSLHRLNVQIVLSSEIEREISEFISLEESFI